MSKVIERLCKKIDNVFALPNIGSIGSPKKAQPQSNTFSPTAPQSKKDPKKIAEQIKNPDAKQITMDHIKANNPKVKFAKNGQWYLE